MALIGIAPNGLEIEGTLETLMGRANITFCKPDVVALEQEGKLSFDWDGDTEIFWDEQKTVRDHKGRRIFLDSEGNQWTADQIELRDEEA
ncbi:MAG: hypothetical protein ABSH25_06255 [Syntrophorhabdales bacterium]|jgi:hypothetical protein